MPATAEAVPVAKKKAKSSESRRFNTLVRMDDDLVDEARKVAALRGVSVAQYFLDLCKPLVKRDLEKEARKLTGGSKGEDS